MNRTSEVETIAATLNGAPKAQTMIRAALTALKQGRLDAAARVMREEVKLHPSLRWAALLVALESAELRLGGSVAFTTPERFAPDVGSTFLEKWGSFSATIEPAGFRLGLELVPVGKGSDYELLAGPYARERGDTILEPVTVLLRELEAYLGINVKGKKKA